MEKTFVMVKPDGVHRGRVGEIITRFERAGLQIVALKMLHISETLAEKHYQEHVGKPFFPHLKTFITSGPVVAMVIQGPQAIQICRKLMGETHPFDAAAGTIRGDFGLQVDYNLIHGSDGKESAAREIALFFSPEELLDYTCASNHWW